MRLDKAVSLAGLSRKEARRAVCVGRVKVSGSVITDAGAAINRTDIVTLDDVWIDLREHLHIMINKPAGYLTATEDARNEPTVMELLPDEIKKRGLGPVGRLDKDVTGLVIMTTDGTLAHRLISPKNDVEKVYTATVEGKLEESAVDAFKRGIALKDFTCKPAKLEIISENVARVTVSEGKFHQVKRMLASVGNSVITLNRDSIAGLELDASLGLGEWRYLNECEESKLYDIAGLNRE